MEMSRTVWNMAKRIAQQIAESSLPNHFSFINEEAEAVCTKLNDLRETEQSTVAGVLECKIWHEAKSWIFTNGKISGNFPLRTFLPA
ncbi:hypothetical protein scyTo_0005914 [Scyliorhinus torazame]|uniref:Uncharacterized protein n=1 Tax=Scyliorhinus torazame TaxID=75743 RepID=A0A401PE13_SCYTO|nr:hypothetical protein [Scyliorhinus torazame]